MRLFFRFLAFARAKAPIKSLRAETELSTGQVRDFLSVISYAYKRRKAKRYLWDRGIQAWSNWRRPDADA